MDHSRFILRALELARKGEGHVRPNPPVGAVVVKSGEIVGEGYHRRCGQDHAETAAIKNALKRLHSADGRLEGCSIYVTLEPCSRPGRVGACTDAIIKSGISKVFFAVSDPNPVNRGRAKRVLRRSGIICESLDRGRVDAAVVRECERLIEPFAKRVATGMPLVTVKIAMSLDGRIADEYGDARWISSARSRKETGRLRERVDAIMVGAETVRKDNPSLLSHGRANSDLIRVVISASGKLPSDAQVFTDGAANPTLVFPDPKTALAELGKMGLTHVLCEGGLKLVRSLADEGLVDRWVHVVSPVVLGSRPIADAQRFKCVSSGFADSFAGDVASLYERRHI